MPVTLEALGGSAVGLHLRHHVAPLSSRRGNVGDARLDGWGCGSGGRHFGSAASGFGVRSGFSFLPSFLRGVQHHRHVATVLAGLRLDHREITDVFGDPAEDPHAELRVGDLTTAQPDRELDLVALVEEAHHVLHLRDVVVLVDLGLELHLLDDDLGGLALRLPAPLFLLVDVPAVVHDPGNRRVGVGRDLDQIELLVTGLCERFREGLDAELLPFGTDEEDLAGSDAVVDPDLVCGYLVTCFIGAWLPQSAARGRCWNGSGREDGGHGKCPPCPRSAHTRERWCRPDTRTRTHPECRGWPGGDDGVSRSEVPLPLVDPERIPA